MAFCNSCGATLNPGAQFCNKCGTAIAGSAAPVPVPATSAPGGGSALRVVLIVVAVIVALGILGIGAVTFVGYHIAKNSRVTQDGQHVNIETPFGAVSANDPDQAVRELGVDLYPGAQALKTGSAAVAFGSVHTVAASFASTDAADKVCAFYKSKFPNATVTSSDRSRCTIVSDVSPNLVTINVQDDGVASKFQITSVTRKSPAKSN